MTITDITVGTATTGNNAPVTPGTPSGLVDGDFMCIVAAIRNSGTGVPNTPAGWSLIGLNANVAMFGRFYQPGDVMPLVTFTGGAANAETYARALKARGVAKDQLTEESAETTNNASAANINYPAVDVPGGNFLLLMAVWRQDDATSLTTPTAPATWTAQGLTNMTAGDDMLVGLFTLLETTELDVSAGAVTVTGGGAAAGRGLILPIRPAPTAAVTLFDLFPPRTLVSITGLTPGDDVAIYRVVDGERTLLRGGSASAVTDPSFTVVDGELPFGETVSYVIVVNSSAEYATAPASYPLPGAKPILSDAISGEASQFVIVSWPSKKYDRRSSVFQVGGRNVVVAGDVGQFTATMEIYFEAWSSSEAFLALLNSATEGVLQLRRPTSAYDGVNCYVAVLSASEDRFSQDGTDQRRTWTLEVAETESWSDGLAAKAFDWQDVIDYYGSTGTWADLVSDHATWLALLQADLS